MSMDDISAAPPVEVWRLTPEGDVDSFVGFGTLVSRRLVALHPDAAREVLEPGGAEAEVGDLSALHLEDFAPAVRRPPTGRRLRCRLVLPGLGPEPEGEPDPDLDGNPEHDVLDGTLIPSIVLGGPLAIDLDCESSAQVTPLPLPVRPQHPPDIAAIEAFLLDAASRDPSSPASPVPETARRCKKEEPPAPGLQAPWCVIFPSAWGCGG